MKLCIIIPAYNEEKRIARTLDDYCEFFSELKKNKVLDFEILVVINNTADRTEEIVKIFKKNCRELNYLNFKQGGKGFAVRKGFEYALQRDFDLIGFVDADDSTNAENFYKLIKGIKGCDGAISSRYVAGSIISPEQTISRIIASRVFNFIVRSVFLLPYKDTQNGGKIFTRKVIEKIFDKISITQWAFDIDVLYNAKKYGFLIKEVPIFWQDAEASKIKLIKSSLQMLMAILQLRLLNSPFKAFWKVLKPLASRVYSFVK